VRPSLITHAPPHLPHSKTYTHARTRSLMCCVYKKAKVSLKIDAQRKWIKREDGMNGAEKYRACFLCHLSLSLSARRSCGPCKRVQCAQEKVSPAQTALSVIKRHYFLVRCADRLVVLLYGRYNASADREKRVAECYLWV
jgi:hypothetical protein